MLECLQRALRVADACMDTAVSVELFVEILNRYVYYFDQQNETVGRLFDICRIRRLTFPGHDKVLKWPGRAHPLEPPDESGELIP